MVLPLVAATLAIQCWPPAQAEGRTNSRLSAASTAVGAQWAERLRLVETEVALAADELADAIDSNEIAGPVEAVRSQASLDSRTLCEPTALTRRIP